MKKSITSDAKKINTQCLSKYLKYTFIILYENINKKLYYKISNSRSVIAIYSSFS